MKVPSFFFGFFGFLPLNERALAVYRISVGRFSSSILRDPMAQRACLSRQPCSSFADCAAGGAGWDARQCAVLYDYSMLI